MILEEEEKWDIESKSWSWRWCRSLPLMVTNIMTDRRRRLMLRLYHIVIYQSRTRERHQCSWSPVQPEHHIILIYKARCASVPAISNVFCFVKIFLKVLYLLFKKFLKGETWSYLGLKARIARIEKLVSSIFKFPDDNSLSTEVCLRQYFMHRAKMGSARKISFIIHVNF